MDEKKKGTRRRGEILEEAILRAAMDELSEIGYQNLTMENVAIRARTNKAVLYRRWPNKSKLISAALHKYVSHKPRRIPNTGDFRNDIYTYLWELVEPLKEFGASTIRGLMSEQFGGGIFASAPYIIQAGIENKLIAAIMEILKNAESRGEIKIEKLTTRVISLPIDLLRYELFTRLEPISDQVIAEIVDDIFLPLIHAKQGI
jgi:AcrR family transcriptional regulator